VQKQSPVAIEDGAVVPSSEPGALVIQWDSAMVDFEVKNLGVTVEVSDRSERIFEISR
jgi:hypothetical protein